MLYFFLKYELIVSSFLKYFNIDISTFTDFERSIIILLSNILSLIIFILILSIFYKLFCRFLNIFKF